MKKFAITLVFAGMILGLAGQGAQATYTTAVVAEDRITVGTFPTTTTTTTVDPTTRAVITTSAAVAPVP